MPTYQYRCKDCGTDLEVVQKFTDAALTECPRCDNGELRKIYNAVGVVFKGSGFYRTDSRDAKSSPAKASDGTQKPGESSGSSGEGKKSESTGSSSGSDSGTTSTTSGANTGSGPGSTSKAAASV